ncbi:hypothetical protein LINGRAHAP2_LOCUS30565 [Linum grandiflorum]
MVSGGDGPCYDGGQVIEVVLAKDVITYSRLKQICTKDLDYSNVDRIFYIMTGAVIADGVIVVAGEADVADLKESLKFGVVSLFIEGARVEAFVADNEDVSSDSENESYGSDPEGEYSAVAANVGVVHLLSDSDRTSDEEFHQAMMDLGVAHRSRVRANVFPDGIEVEQLNEVSVNQARPEEVIVDDGAPENDQQGDEDDPAVDGDDEMGEPNSDGSDYEAPVNQVESLSSYRASSMSNHVVDDKVDGEEVSSMDRQSYLDPMCDHKTLVLKEGLKFTSPVEFKECIVNYCVAVETDIRWIRSNKKNKEAMCTFAGCKWRVFASWYRGNEAFVIKSIGDPHSCPRTMHSRCASAKWLAKMYLSSFRINPNYDPKHLVVEAKETYDIDVSLRVCVNARIEAKKMLEGSLNDAYAKLRSYVLQLMKSDPDGKFVIEVDPVEGVDHVLFRRIYIGFSCLKKGFLLACRPIFAVDGCFLKGEVKGMLLAAVGKDGNNQMFPIAWAVVEGENRNSWNWFINLLQEQLGLDDGTGWSIISDQQNVSVLNIFSITVSLLMNCVLTC